MKVLNRLWAASIHTKIAVGCFALGAFIGALILTVHYQGIDGRGGQKEMELGELWVGVGFFGIVAPAVILFDQWRLRRQAREKQRAKLPPLAQTRERRRK